MNVTKLTTQKVAGLLRAAGFSARQDAKRIYRRGFSVRKLSRFIVGVVDWGTDLEGCAKALEAAGLIVHRDLNSGILKVAKPS